MFKYCYLSMLHSELGGEENYDIEKGQKLETWVGKERSRRVMRLMRLGLQ
jgi:hypothetical protein